MRRPYQTHWFISNFKTVPFSVPTDDQASNLVSAPYALQDGGGCHRSFMVPPPFTFMNNSPMMLLYAT